jgi:polysaccharide deacetylase family protein (PEP-CTERM system associated)
MDLSQTNAMTIDVEDWYNSSLDIFKDSDVPHGSMPDKSVVDNTLVTLDLLSETNNKATFFVLGTVAQHYPDLVREISNRGHEIATHGYSHQLVYNMTPESFEEDLKISLDHLANAGSAEILGYRAPYWSITKKSLWALDSLKKSGMKYDSSIFPIKRGLYGIHDAKTYPNEIIDGLWEFPPATVRLFGVNLPIAGGGYLRLMPYKVISGAIRKSASKYTRAFYFHPYELDPEDIELQHKTRSMATILYWLQQKMGRASNPEKLRRLLTEFKFQSFKHILSEMDLKG